MNLPILIWTIHSLFYKLSTWARESGRSMEGRNFKDILPIIVPKNYRGKAHVLTRKLSNSSKFYYKEPGFYPSNTDFVETLNTRMQERHNQTESCITVRVSRRTQKVNNYLADEGSGLAFFKTDLRHIFGDIVGFENGVMLRGAGPYKPEFAYDIVRINSLNIYTDLIESNIVGDTKAPFVCCFPFKSKLKDGTL